MKNYLKKNLFSILIGCVLGLPFSAYAVNHREKPTLMTYYDPRLFEQFAEQAEQAQPEADPYEMTQEELEEELFYDSLELLACCVEAEAGNQDLYGKRLVVDVVLNRVDSPDFPDTIEEVILQRGSNGVYQFSVVGNGRIYQMEPAEETYEAIRLELESRTNTEILFFTAEGYIPYGKPWAKVWDHYFSTGRK